MPAGIAGRTGRILPEHHTASHGHKTQRATKANHLASVFSSSEAVAGESLGLAKTGTH